MGLTTKIRSSWDLMTTGTFVRVKRRKVMDSGKFFNLLARSAHRRETAPANQLSRPESHDPFSWRDSLVNYLLVMPAPQIFPNSLQHRRRVRLWMAALVALPMLTGVQFGEVHPRLWKAIGNESVPSTRFFIEWAIILGLLKHQRPEDLQNLLSRLLEFSQATGTAISLLTVTMHVGLKLEGELKERFFELAFDRILPWHLHNNHMVRLFASFVFDRLWSRVITDQYLLSMIYT